MAASVVEISVVDQRDGEVIMFFWGLERPGRSFAELLRAGVQVNSSAIGEFPHATRAHLLQQGLGTLVFVLLHGLQTSLIVLHSLCKTRIEAEIVVGRFSPRGRDRLWGSPSKYFCNLQLRGRLFKFCLGFFYHSHLDRCFRPGR